MLKEILEGLNIPVQTKDKLKLETVRNQIFENFGEDAFLDPTQKKFPIVNPDTGELNTKLVYCAYLQACLTENKSIKEKARNILEQNNRLNITIGEKTHPITEITDLLFLDHEQLDLNWIE
ncbi:MAG: hypothetical protein H7836_13115 [Magnetococcus sp. YQC-3]